MEPIPHTTPIPYNILALSVPLQTLKDLDKTVQSLYDNTLTLSMSYLSVIEEFTSRIATVERPLSYFLDIIHMDASRNRRFRFLILNTGNDCVFLSLRLVTPIKGQQYFLITLPPVSYHNMQESTLSVLDVLRQFPTNYIRGMLVTEPYPTNPILNNYYNLHEDYERMCRSHWRTKNGINRLQRLIQFIPESDQIPLIEQQVLVVNDLWNRIKSHDTKNKNTFWNPYSKERGIISLHTDERLTLLAKKHPNIILMTFYYNNHLIGYSIGYLLHITPHTPTEHTLTQLYLSSTKQITGDYTLFSSYTGTDDEDSRFIHKHLSYFMQYRIHQYAFESLNVGGVYNYGDFDVAGLYTRFKIAKESVKVFSNFEDFEVSGLREFKRTVYKHVTYYNIIPLTHYLTTLNTPTERSTPK